MHDITETSLSTFILKHSDTILQRETTFTDGKLLPQYLKLPRGSKFFPLREAPIEMGDKYFYIRLVSLGNVKSHIPGFTCLSSGEPQVHGDEEVRCPVSKYFGYLYGILHTVMCLKCD